MSARASDPTPVAVRCRCGNRIVLEPRWIGKPTGCAQCEAQFIVLMVADPRTKRLVPYVQFTTTRIARKKEVERAGWANVTCECGSKIGLQPEFIGKELACSRCGRSFVVTMKPGTAAVYESKTPPTKKPAPLVRGTEKKPAPPSEMHLLCVCGEELAVAAAFYNKNMYCAGCGALMHLKLGFSPETRQYELQGTILAGPK